MTMLACAASWRLVESPVIRWAARVSNRLFAAPPSRKVMSTDAAPVA
jgi:hypothetical protein